MAWVVNWRVVTGDPTHATVIPAKARIQYAAASPLTAGVSGMLDHPLSRVMTAVIGAARRFTDKAGMKA
jgi:hypothetical protein